MSGCWNSEWFDVRKGFGFIEMEVGEDIFVHFQLSSEGFKRLEQGENVEFDIVETERGSRQQMSKSFPSRNKP